MKKAIEKLLKLNINTPKELMLVKRKLAKEYNISILQNSDILKEYKQLLQTKKIKANSDLEKLLRKRSIRTSSGIAPVAVLTKPYECPGKCAYCPTEKNVPQSYLSNEPAVMRAIRCNYNPYIQVQDRLRALEANGHNPTKIELIVIGGTWSYFPDNYKYWYIAECFRGANEFNGKQSETLALKNKFNNLQTALKKQQKKNETAKYQIIGLTLETRPDYIDEKELWQMRELGCTRVEIGVQAIDDEVLKLNKRGCNVQAIINATSLLRKYGFKITYHFMPGLPGSSSSKDFKMYEQIYSDKNFQPDQIKFYPTVVTAGSLLYKWWRAGKYKPYSDKVLQNLIIKCKNITPVYTRIIRLIRDIPGESIIAGNKITNLRQIMKDKGTRCQCIRCREPKDSPVKSPQLNIVKYEVSNGQEYFINFESKDKKNIYGFCRLFLPTENATYENKKLNNLFKNTAIVRELHVYGQLVPVGDKKLIQHAGLGKKLMAEAEKQAQKNGFKKIAVISGVGVRGYYRKLGYELRNSYMVKKLI